MPERNVYQITPFMHVNDVETAVRFFTDLGFDCPYRQPGYAYVSLEGAGIRIQHHDDPDELGVAHRGFAYYVDVRDLDPILEALKPKLETMPPGDVHGPVDQSYNQRELMIRAPDGNLLVFGQSLD